MRDFKSYFMVPAEPSDVFAAITNPITIRLWTGEDAEMVLERGSEFTMWDGSICGKILDFEENKKLVQQWYFGEQDVPSIVTIKLHPHKQGTSVELIHTHIPDEDYNDIVDGWRESYFGAIIDFYSI